MKYVLKGYKAREISHILQEAIKDKEYDYIYDPYK
jgi:hypothetical protein